MKKKAAPGAVPAKRPYCFFSYSTREPHVALLLECCGFVFSERYTIEVTPSALIAGASQRDRITELVKGCSFGIVSLDGLRANVAFEYGMLHALRKPVILMKERSAQVDVKSLFHDSANIAFDPVPLNIDAHFSNVKDVTYVTWDRHSFVQTAKILREEFSKKKNEVEPYIEIPELW
jgi:hypothetical protein